MDFKTLLVLTFVVSSVVSGLDKWMWSRQRQEQLNKIKEKKRNIDFNSALEVLKKPEWVSLSDNLFVMSCVAFVVWAMLPNFELILVVALAVSLVITIIEKTFIKKKKAAELQELYQRNANPSEDEVEFTKKMPWWVDYGWSFFPLLFIIVALRSFFYEPFKIPSSSMEPTLWVHDFILVNKFEYGLRLPVTKTRLTEGNKPKRADVVVFRAPHEPEKDYIKRLIGLPGDTVFYTRNKELYVVPSCENEEVIGFECGKKHLISKSLEKSEYRGLINTYTENLFGIEHEIKTVKRSWNDESEIASNYYLPWEKGVVVPDNMYFVMGDNRDNSSDSRFWGFVPDSMMVGRARAIWLHLEFGLAESGFLSYIPTGVNFDRVGAIK